MVFANDRFSVPPETSSLEALAITHIGFDRDGAPGFRPTRAGIVAELSVSGERVKLLGGHLKSFCHRWSLEPIQDQNASGKPYDSRW